MKITPNGNIITKGELLEKDMFDDLSVVESVDFSDGYIYYENYNDIVNNPKVLYPTKSIRIIAYAKNNSSLISDIEYPNIKRLHIIKSDGTEVSSSEIEESYMDNSSKQPISIIGDTASGVTTKYDCVVKLKQVTDIYELEVSHMKNGYYAYSVILDDGSGLHSLVYYNDMIRDNDILKYNHNRSKNIKYKLGLPMIPFHNGVYRTNVNSVIPITHNSIANIPAVSGVYKYISNYSGIGNESFIYRLLPNAASKFQINNLSIKAGKTYTISAYIRVSKDFNSRYAPEIAIRYPSWSPYTIERYNMGRIGEWQYITSTFTNSVDGVAVVSCSTELDVNWTKGFIDIVGLKVDEYHDTEHHINIESRLQCNGYMSMPIRYIKDRGCLIDFEYRKSNIVTNSDPTILCISESFTGSAINIGYDKESKIAYYKENDTSVTIELVTGINRIVISKDRRVYINGNYITTMPVIGTNYVFNIGKNVADGEYTQPYHKLVSFTDALTSEELIKLSRPKGVHNKIRDASIITECLVESVGYNKYLSFSLDDDIMDTSDTVELDTGSRYIDSFEVPAGALPLNIGMLDYTKDFTIIYYKDYGKSTLVNSIDCLGQYNDSITKLDKVSLIFGKIGENIGIVDNSNILTNTTLTGSLTVCSNARVTIRYREMTKNLIITILNLISGDFLELSTVLAKVNYGGNMYPLFINCADNKTYYESATVSNLTMMQKYLSTDEVNKLMASISIGKNYLRCNDEIIEEEII